MYKIYSDDLVLYHPLLDDYTAIEAKLDLEINHAGKLVFSLPDSNPHYGMTRLMKSIVTVYDDDKLIFRGRPYAPNRNLYNDNEITCEGDLAFFNDTVQGPFEYFGSVSGLLSRMIAEHNNQVTADKQFVLGEVTVTNNTEEGNIVRSSIDYMSTWEFIKSKFIDSNLGGFIRIRHDADKNYVDYLSEFTTLGNQTIEQCVNLVEAEEKITAEGLATAIIPLGAKIKDSDGNETDESLTVASVNNGSIKIESHEGISAYGYVAKIVEHGDISDATALLAAGHLDLAVALGVEKTIELSATDLAKAGYSVNSFSIGSYVKASIENLKIDSNMLVSKLGIDLLNPGSNKVTLGRTVKTFTSDSIHTSETIEKIESNMGSDIRSNKNEIKEVVRETSSLIDQASDSIMSTVQENYYPKDDTDEIISSVRTEIEQTSSDVEIRFEEFQKDIESMQGGNDAKFTEISKYIRFEDGKIIIGIVDNPMILQQANDMVSFIENGAVVSYWKNRKFYSVDGEFLNSLQLGKFSFMPRSNGNLSLMKVVD